MNIDELNQRIAGIHGYMGSVTQRAFMHNLGAQTTIALELGSFHGLSAAIVGLGMLEAGGERRYVCADTFESSSMEAKGTSTFESFVGSMERLGLTKLITPVQGDVHTAETVLRVQKEAPDGYDWMYVDADHRPSSVVVETLLYAPLVKPNGIILYHDATWESVRKGIDICAADGYIEIVEIIDDYLLARRL